MVTSIAGISFRSERNWTKRDLAGKNYDLQTQHCKSSTKFISFRKILLNFYLFEDKVKRKGHVQKINSLLETNS